MKIIKTLSIFAIIYLVLNCNLNLQSADEGLQPPETISDFKGGFDTDTATNKLTKIVAQDIYNADLDETNALTMRKGSEIKWVLPVPTTFKILSEYAAIYDDGGSEFMVHVGTLVLVTSGDGVFTTINSLPVSSEYPIDFEMINNEVWMTNGIDKVAVWDRQNYTQYDFIPKGRYITYDKFQVLMAGMFDDPSNVRFTNILSTNTSSVFKSADDWNSLNGLKCGDGDGQTITGMFKLNNRVYVTKENSTYALVTDASYVDASPQIRSDLYGSISDRSSNKYKSAQLILNKNGLFGYDGNFTFQPIGDNINSLLNKIGKLNTDYGRWTTTTKQDFDAGTFENCTNDAGTVIITSHTKLWESQADFTPVFYSSVTTVINGDITITTATGAGVYKYTLNADTYDGMVYIPNLNQNNGTTPVYDPKSGDYSYATDTDDSSYVCLIPQKTNQFVYFNLKEYTNGQMRPKYVRIKCQNTIYDSAFQQILQPVNYDPTYFGGAYVKTSDNVSGNINDIGIVVDQYQKNVQELAVSINEPSYSDPNKGYPYRIFLQLASAKRNVDSRFSYALKVYDISASSENTNTSYLSSGTYVSPTHNAGANTYFTYLHPTHWLGNSTSSGTINYSVRASDSLTMVGATDYFRIGTSSQTPVDIDNKQYVQFKAELQSFTTGFTPTIYDTQIEYVTLPSTYTSKVFNVSSKNTEFGNFIERHSGTVVYEIRGATWTFAYNNADGVSGVSTWKTIVNADPITFTGVTFATTCTSVQWRAKLQSKYANVESTTILWFEGNPSETSGGTQELGSINYKDRYYLSYSTWTTYNTDVLVFDKNGAFTRYDWDVNGFVEFNNKFLFTSSTQPIILQGLTGNTDTGQPISLYRKSGDMDFGYPDIEKTYRYVYLTGKKQNNSFVWLDTFIDYATTPTKSIYCDLSQESNFRLQMDDQSYGKNIAIALRSTATVCEVQINNILWKPKRLSQE